MRFLVTNENIIKEVELLIELRKKRNKRIKEISVKYGCSPDTALADNQALRGLVITKDTTVDKKAWKRHKKHSNVITPKRNTKEGKAIAEELKSVGELDFGGVNSATNFKPFFSECGTRYVNSIGIERKTGNSGKKLYFITINEKDFSQYSFPDGVEEITYTMYEKLFKELGT